MVDPFLDWAAVLLPMLLSVAGVFVSIKAPNSKHHTRLRVGLIAVGIFASAVTFWQQSRSRAAHKVEVDTQTRKIDNLKDEVQKARLDGEKGQAYLRGQLDAQQRMLGIIAANSDPKQTVSLMKSLGEARCTLKKRTLKLASDIDAFDKSRWKVAPVSKPNATPEDNQKYQTDAQAWQMETNRQFQERFADRSIGIIQEFRAKGVIAGKDLDWTVAFGYESQAMPVHLKAMANRIDDNCNIVN